MKSRADSNSKRAGVAVDARVRRFTADEKACIAHALDHLRVNKIADDNYQHSGWYCGNREQFVKRHRKALIVLDGFLSPNGMDERGANPSIRNHDKTFMSDPSPSNCSGDTGRFTCAKCDGLFHDSTFHRMPDGKYCTACLLQWKANNAAEISKMSVGERFRALFGLAPITKPTGKWVGTAGDALSATLEVCRTDWPCDEEVTEEQSQNTKISDA